MRKCLYYDDAYTAQFNAVVVTTGQFDQQPAVLLQTTYFYPTSGGQPNDTGMIGSARVVDVVRDEQQRVWHLLDSPLECGRYAAAIDWPRRHDHMQQHSGQHILSAAFIELFDAATVGFHLGSGACTIDLTVAELSDAELRQVEALANEVVWQNRPINSSWVAVSVAHEQDLRKLPEVAGDRLRIIEIAEFDRNACGGTHVRSTAEVGIIKITGRERVRGNVRVEFRCGGRALADYRLKQQIVSDLSNDMTCAAGDLRGNIDNLRQELKQANKQIKRQQQQLLANDAKRLDEEEAALVTAVLAPYGVGELRQIANRLIATPGRVVLLAGRAGFVFARSRDAAGDMNGLLQQVLAQTGGRGGGSSQMAQGGGGDLSDEQLQSALRLAVAEMDAARQTVTAKG